MVGRLVWATAAAFGTYAVWLSRGLLDTLAGQSGERWPLPGLFIVITLAIAFLGVVAIMLLNTRWRAGAGLSLWLAGGALVGFGVVSGFSVGQAILPGGVALLAIATIAHMRRLRGLLGGVVLAAAASVVGFFAVPLLAYAPINAGPLLPALDASPAPGEIDVPLESPIRVTAHDVDGNGVGYSLGVSYADRGLFWLRPEISGGLQSTAPGPLAVTFRAAEPFESCRTVRVELDVEGYRPHAYTFRTDCRAPRVR